MSQDPNQAPQQKVHLDESDMTVDYANAFRTVTSPEDIMVDFGVNVVLQTPQGNMQPGDVHFKTNRRMVMNYFTAKRLALTLSQAVVKYEETFGPLELDPDKRATNK